MSRRSLAGLDESSRLTKKLLIMGTLCGLPASSDVVAMHSSKGLLLPCLCDPRRVDLDGQTECESAMPHSLRTGANLPT